MTNRPTHVRTLMKRKTMLNYKLYIYKHSNTATKLQVLQILFLEPLLYVLSLASSALNACLDLDIYLVSQTILHLYVLRFMSIVLDACEKLTHVPPFASPIKFHIIQVVIVGKNKHINKPCFHCLSSLISSVHIPSTKEASSHWNRRCGQWTCLHNMSYFTSPKNWWRTNNSLTIHITKKLMEGLTIQTLYNIRGQNQNSKTSGYKIQKPSNFSSVFCTLTTLFIYLFICNLKKIKIKINGQNLSFVLKFNFPCARC